MKESNSTEKSFIKNNPEHHVGNEPKGHILPQEEVYEQKNHIAPLINERTWLG